MVQGGVCELHIENHYGMIVLDRRVSDMNGFQAIALNSRPLPSRTSFAIANLRKPDRIQCRSVCAVEGPAIHAFSWTWAASPRTSVVHFCLSGNVVRWRSTPDQCGGRGFADHAGGTRLPPRGIAALGASPAVVAAAAKQAQDQEQRDGAQDGPDHFDSVAFDMDHEQGGQVELRGGPAADPGADEADDRGEDEAASREAYDGLRDGAARGADEYEQKDSDEGHGVLRVCPTVFDLLRAEGGEGAVPSTEHVQWRLLLEAARGVPHAHRSEDPGKLPADSWDLIEMIAAIIVSTVSGPRANTRTGV